MNNSEHKKALGRLKKLYVALTNKYPDDFEYIGRDVVSALMDCEKKGGGSADVESYEREGV